MSAEPEAGDVEALTRILLDSARHIADAYDVARAVLASDWLAARDARVHREGERDGLRAAAQDVFYESGVQWGRPDWQQWLRDRAARIGQR